MGKIKNKILSLMLASTLILGLMPTAFAYEGYTEVTEPGGIGNSEITLTVENIGGELPPDPDKPVDPPTDPEPVLFSAWVPNELPIKMDLDGNVTVPTNAIIINGVETKGICVTDINVTMNNGWQAANWDDDFSIKPENSQEFGLKLRSDYLSSSGSFSLNSLDWKIAKNSYIDLNMGAKLPKQTDVGNKGKVATVGFTLDWSGDDETTGPSIPAIPPVDPNPPTTDRFTISYTTDGNGTVVGNATSVIDKDSNLIFPTISANEGYVFDKWINTDTNEEVTTSTIVISNMSIKALFKVAEQEMVSVTFVAGENGSLEGQTSTEILSGETLSTFPTAKPNSIRYAMNQWVNIDTNEEVTTTTPIVSDTTVKAVFSEKATSPKNWFTTNGANIITGLSSEYLNLVDAPTDLVIPNNIGGSTITIIGANAFANKDLITSIVLPDTITSIQGYAFKNCTGLKNILIPKFVNVPITYFYDNDKYIPPFVNCPNLIVEFEKGISMLPSKLFCPANSSGTPDGSVIGYEGQIKEIIIPNSVYKIDGPGLVRTYVEKITIDNSAGSIEKIVSWVDNTREIDAPWGGRNKTTSKSSDVIWLR